ncbi:MAG: Outer membrane protein assembly factor BamD [Chlamydiia bacterium]|nr:Outer membrane protein assembly factor BamD [Chlamydiia bacterium]
MKKYLLPFIIVSSLIFGSEEEQFSDLKTEFHNKEWSKVVSHSQEMIKKYPESVFSKEINFFRAVAYYHIDDPDLANQYLTAFLEMGGSTRYFEDALKYKYFIAEKFENGYYGHLFGVSALPRFESMWESAYQLYDEVIVSIPRSDLAAKALFRKSAMYLLDEQFEESIESLNNLIRRFPRNPLAQEAYVNIAKVYRKQIKVLYLDPRCYELALLNKKRFDMEYPSSPLKIEMEEVVADIVDYFAEDIYKSAIYFDKRNNSESSIMYLRSLVQKYPTSKYAIYATQKIAAYELSLDKKKVNEIADIVN